MASIHLMLQGKGGVGKSMIFSMAYQGIEAQGKKVIIYDTDPVNATLAGYHEFHTKKLELLDSNNNIDPRKFDELLQDLAEADDDTHILVDNGASSFLALGAYIKENDMIEALEELGHNVYLHTVITGGQAIIDTVDGFTKLVTAFQNSPLIVWLNPFFGEIELDGNKFTDFKVYRAYEKNIHAVIELPVSNQALIGKDLEQLFAKKQSFEVGINNTGHIAVRSRLKKYWTQVQELMLHANFY